MEVSNWPEFEIFILNVTIQLFFIQPLDMRPISFWGKIVGSMVNLAD